QSLFAEFGQSPWLDNLSRPYLQDGTLRRLVGDGIRGVTANPTILARAIEGTAAYDEQFAALVRSGLAVPDAYWELVVDDIAGGGDPSRVHSVASFFVSRVDTEIDARLEKLGISEGSALRGRAAVAQAKLAYRLFQQHFSGERWSRLSSLGAHVQRPLWASTSTKNPAYSDTVYVESLIGPDTVNTLTEATVAAFERSEERPVGKA